MHVTLGGISSLADSKEIFTEFIDDVSPVPFVRDFNTLVNKAILDTGVRRKADWGVVHSKEMTQQQRTHRLDRHREHEGIADGRQDYQRRRPRR